jgi:hypothetical protein
MAIDESQNADSIQKLAGLYERKIGISRLTKDTISQGPDVLAQKAFNSTITQYVDSLVIFDSLDGAFRMADMVISDPISFRATAPLTGHEIISVSYSNALSTSSTKQKIIHFMIHNITEDIDASSTTVNLKKLTIKLIEFPAFEFLASNQYYKTYPIDERNTPKHRFSDIVKDMLNGIEDFTKWYDLDIEDSTSNSVNFFVPNWCPLKVLNFCKKFAISEKKKYPMYIFHIGNKGTSDKPVAHFKPVYSFVDDSKKYRAYGHAFNEVQDPSDTRTGTYSPVDTIHEHSFEYFDSQNVGSLSGDTGVLFDYLEDNTYIANDYDTYLISTFKGLAPYPTYPFGHGNQWSRFHRSGWNYTEGRENIKNKIQNDYATCILRGGVKCKAMAYVFEGRECGERAELIFNIVSNDKINDKMMSGAWITWSITDTFIGGQGFSTITFYNDGFNEIIDQTNTFSKINTITGTNAPETIEQ